jgi:hypothetical protein
MKCLTHDSECSIRHSRYTPADARKLRRVRHAPPHHRQFALAFVGGPAQPSPTIAQCLNGGYGWLEVKCRRCDTRGSIPLDAVRRPRDKPIWKLEAALKCRSCKKGRYAPSVHLIKLTTEREIAPYVSVHPDDEQ